MILTGNMRLNSNEIWIKIQFAIIICTMISILSQPQCVEYFANGFTWLALEYVKSMTWNKDFYTRSRYLRQGYVIASHSILWDAITYPCLSYLLLATKSTNHPQFCGYGTFCIPYIDRWWWLSYVNLISIIIISWYCNIAYKHITLWSYTHTYTWKYHTNWSMIFYPCKWLLERDS